MKTVTSMQARCSPLKCGSSGRVCRAWFCCGLCKADTALSWGQPRSFSTSHSSWSDTWQRCSSKSQHVISFCISIEKTLLSSSGEWGWKVRKESKYTYLVAGLYKELLHPSLSWEYLEYISSGVACAILSSLCCKSWHTVWAGFIGAEL